MDTDGGLRIINIITSVIFIYVKAILIIISKFYITNTYILSNEKLVNQLEKKLFQEGYCIEKICNFIYLVHPVLYERK